MESGIDTTEGELELTPLNSPTPEYPGGTEHLPPHSNLHYPCIEDFVNAMVDDRPPCSSGATALLTEWILEQAKTANGAARAGA